MRAALDAIHAVDEETLSEQMRIAAIAAPSNDEAARADFMADRLRQLGVVDVASDAVGNVTGRVPGDAAGLPVVVSAHLDTVFAADVPLQPRREGSRISAPGITDNARGLAALLTLAKVILRHDLRFGAPLHFAATVGEEGIGDLRGVKHLFRSEGPFSDAAAFISLDGAGLRRIVHRAVGSRRLRCTVEGPGGHSWSDWGAPNPIHALGAAIGALREISLPADPPATLTVARISGGTSINAIPETAWLEVDIRSQQQPVLERIEADARTCLAAAITAENARRRAGTRQLSARVEVIGDRPGGMTASDDPLIVAAQRATRAVGARPELVASSTDANIPMSLGIPAVTLGAGGQAGGVHTVSEWYDNRAGALGIERALLLLAEVASLVAGDPAYPGRLDRNSA